MSMNQRANTQDRSGYNNRHQSTKFDLEALRANNQQEIKKVAKKYSSLSQKQKDLIRHQAPEAFLAINKIVESAFSTSSEAHKHTNQAHDRNSERMSSERQQTFHSEKTRDEKRDAYGHADRQHERDTKAQNDRHNKTQETTLSIAKVTAAAAVAVTAIFSVARLFGGGSK